MTNKTREFVRRGFFAIVITFTLLCKPTMVSLAREEYPEAPQACWWDDIPEKAGVARCSEVKDAKEYKFKLYRENELVATATSNKNHHDFAKELAKYFYDRESTNYYVRAQAINSVGTSDMSIRSTSLKEWQWVELFYYCSSKNIDINAGNNSKIVSSIDINVKSGGYNALPYLSTASGSAITEINWTKTKGLKAGMLTTATVTIIPINGYEILLPNGKDSINLKGDKAKVYKYTRKEQSFTLEIDYIIPGQLEAPVAVYWDDRTTKAGVARCSEIEYADEYEFKLYNGSCLVATVTSNNNHYDFAKELAKYYYSKNDNFYFTVKVNSTKEQVQSSNYSEGSESFTSSMWSDLKEYCDSKKIEVS